MGFLTPTPSAGTSDSGGTTTNHEELDGLLGGAPNDHQHLTTEQLAQALNAVAGPASSDDEYIPLWDGITGKLLKNGIPISTFATPADLVSKADISYVDSENDAQDAIIAGKADTSYVDAANAAQDVVIAGKADISYVDAQDAAHVLDADPHPQYAMQSDLDSLAGNVVVGPASSNDSTVALFDGITGRVIKDSGLGVQSSAYDSTSGNLAKVGMGGLLGTLELALDADDIAHTQFNEVAAGSANIPEASTGLLFTIAEGNMRAQWYIKAVNCSIYTRTMFGGVWQPWIGTTSPSITDHGDLTGLLDDDHPQYLTEDRANALYALLGHIHAVVTTSVDGFMSAADKTKLDSLASGGYGDVYGPGLSVDGYIPLWDGTAGQFLEGGIPTSTFAKVVDLGTAAYKNTTTSATDNTADRVLKVGDGGVITAIATTDLNAYAGPLTACLLANNTTLNTPIAGGWFVIWNINGVQIAARLGSTPSAGNVSIHTRTLQLDGVTWSAWVAIYEDTGWVAPTLENGFVSEAYSPVKYRRLNGVVYVRGRVTKTALPADDTTIFTLPTGFRNTAWYQIAGINSLGDSPGNTSPVIISTNFNGLVQYGKKLNAGYPAALVAGSCFIDLECAIPLL